jgi:hypothetical protein
MKMTSVRLPRSLGWLLLALMVLAVPGQSFAQGIGVSITVAPPVLPLYVQPVCPGEGYLWTPGYWAWDDGDYYWVPGTWVLAPEIGFLWTPGYWGWGDGGYLWHDGYWGENVGFYGGIDYGFGYMGTGFEGGYWQTGQFFYNTSVMHVNTTIIHNTYNKTVINGAGGDRVSYNGGTGGTKARPTAEQERYASERHVPPMAGQTRHQQTAASDRSQRASVNHGKPPVAATAKAGDFKSGVVAARTGIPGRNTNTASAQKKPFTPPNHENTAKTAKTRTESTPSKTATTEHANARRTQAKPAPAHHENTAKTKTASKPSKAATTEHASARHTQAKPTPAPHENTAKTKTESKPVKAATTEHATARPTEAKLAAAPHASTAKTESKASRPATTQHASARPAEPRRAPAPHPPATHTESRPAAPPAHHEAAAQSQRAPQPVHQSAPHAENKPAPAPREEKKPPR